MGGILPCIPHGIFGSDRLISEVCSPSRPRIAASPNYNSAAFACTRSRQVRSILSRSLRPLQPRKPDAPLPALSVTRSDLVPVRG
jgi:hypothetical protein